jgi:outer membrane protein OmpA-like peptidoglycan-associated protein
VEERIYFKVGSTQLERRDINSKIGEIAKFLKLNPGVKLRIVGYSSKLNESGNNGKIARERAITVKQAFEAQGIDSDRLKITAKTSLPPNLSTGDPKWLGRCATFFVIN